MSQPARVYALLAHHDPSSFNTYLYNHITQALEQQSLTVDKLDLYARFKDIPFYFPHQTTPSFTGPTQQDFPFFSENKDRFLAADYLLIVYPIYWYSMPGILKTWIDLITNFAWKYEGGPRARALHRIKHVFVVQTSFQPRWRRRWLDGDLERRQLSKTFDFIGIKGYTFYDIGAVHLLKKTEQEYHATTVVKKCSQLFSPPK